MPAVLIDPATVKDEVGQTLQAFIDQETAKQQSLYDQRDALKAQVRALNDQINTLNAQIASGESDDLKKARAKKRAFEMIESGEGGPVLRVFL